jgi:hypothetical protein
MESSFCTGCGRREPSRSYKPHPLLDVPICSHCMVTYHSGYVNLSLLYYALKYCYSNELGVILLDRSFIIENGNEIYCRWCGQGEGSLCLCDSCPKAFCTGCIFRNFGNSEVQRILRLQNRWSCYICSPQALEDYILRFGWRTADSSNPKPSKIPKLKSSSSQGNLIKGKVICYDVSRGREHIEIPVINDVDREPAPLDFVYVTGHVPGKDVILTNNPDRTTCCTCVDNCTNIETCTCLQIMNGAAYDEEGILSSDKSATGVYECNSRCSCHINGCRNRIVSKGPHLKLEVFRCPVEGKGWGVRCRTNIPPGTFIADYSGELIPERIADSRGLNFSDEYLFNLDFFGCQRACNLLTDIGIKRGLDAVSKEHDIDISVLSEQHVEKILGKDFADFLSRSGAIARAQELGMKRSSATGAEADRRRVYQPKSPLGNRKKPKPSNSATTSPDAVPANQNDRKSWYEIQHEARLRDWRRARSILSDRVILSTESEYSTYTVDAKSFGSIGRFLNHSCEPNLDKVTVFTDSHDPRTARVAFFAAEFIPAYSELCYDYGYQPGNVDGKHKECLCGSSRCRKVWY